MEQHTPLSPAGMVVYGLGSFGQAVVDEMIAAGIAVDSILDRARDGDVYRDIPVRSLGSLEADGLAGKTVILGLHNHYVDIASIHVDLIAAGAARVLTPTNLRDLLPAGRAPGSYWLDPGFEYASHAADLAQVRNLFVDDKSRTIFDSILTYRQSGNILDCPSPSLDDEYTPSDLPRFAEPLRIIDCGAFTGVAIHKFLTAKYAVESFFAFEPDLANFAKLSERKFPVERGVCLPLGTWSTTRQLSFSSDSSMASHLSEQGETTIQCVAVDDVLKGEHINLVKLDVEGAEIETLKGMKNIIHEQRPNLLVSAYHTPGHLFEIAQLICSWDLGYQFHLRVHEQSTFGVVLYALQERLLATRAVS